MTAIRTPSPPTPPLPALPDARSRPVSIDGIRQLLHGLDRRQRQAVTHGDGPLLVVAGPGTGKTEVITRRVAWLIASRRARPSEILALTFTERAADEMQARVDVLVPYGQTDTAIHTFHAFGDRLLRDHGHAIGRPMDPRVIGRTQAVVLLRDHVFDLGLERYRPLGDPTRFVGALVDVFARAKEEGLGPDDLAAYAEELEAGARAATNGADPAVAEAVGALIDEAGGYAEVARAFDRYQRLLTERSLVDHGDQIAQAVRLLEERAAVRVELRRRFRYIVVDEAQDANPQQLRLVRSLAGPRGNVTFVGDDDQAIYSFRGGVGEALAGLPDDFEGMHAIALARNYRSRAPILETARRLIRHNDPDRLETRHGIDKTLTAVRRARRPARVIHRAYATTVEEADAVAADIRRRLEEGALPGSIAVLVRTNADARPMLASLDVLGIPRRSSGSAGLFRHREVRDILSLMRVIAAPEASEDLYAVLTSAPYRLGGEALTAICESAARRRRSLWSVVTELVEQPGLLRLAPGARDQLSRAVEDVRRSIADAHERSAPAVLYDHLRRSGWLPRLVADAERGDDAPLRRVARLFEIVQEQSELLSDARMAMVVPGLMALLDAGQEPSAPEQDDLPEGVAVLTVHQAKGLEFETVFVIGLAEGRFPVRARRETLSLPPALTGRPSVHEPDAHLAEERRLLYVAMTRARDELVLTHAAAGARGGRQRRPSPFLAEALGSAVHEGVAALPATIVPPAEDQLATTATRSATAATTAPDQPLELSFSQVDDYLTCPLKYRLRHRIRVPTPPHHALVLGNALHQGVAAANLARKRGLVIEAATARGAFEAHWTSEGFLSQEHESARYDAGLAALERFVVRSSQDPGDRIVAVEQPFSVRIGADRVRGRYDAVRETTAGTVITDYKSGDVRDPIRARARARASLQLPLYAIAWEAETGRRPDAVELHFLEGDVIGRVVPTEKQLQRAREQVSSAAEGIRRGAFDATPGYPACDWCPYRRICPTAA